jgi:hypothetical protein
MESKEDLREVYNRTFPYYQIDDKEQFYWANAVESALLLREIGESKKLESKFSYFDDLLLIFRVLEEQFHIKPASTMFLDCIGNCGVACLLSVCFRYKKCISIEFTEENLSLGRELLTELRSKNVVQGSTVKFKSGSFLDYFEYEAEVVLFSTHEAKTYLGIDEGYLVGLFLKMCANLVSGSLIVVFTNFLSLDTENCQKMGFSYLQCVYERLPTFQGQQHHSSHLKNYILKKR